MHSRSGAAAVHAFLGRIQQTLSCVTPGVLIEGQFGPDPVRAATFGSRYVPMRGRYRLELSILHEHELIQADNRWSLHAAGYSYQIRQADGPEIAAFHWHPRSALSPVTFPHLHIERPVSPVDIGSGRHIPTGHVSIEAVVRFLIKELHVRPLRADWESVITDNEAHFDAIRTW
ncbi:MAG TPA: hypothetical protein VFL82_05330 [Thermomicrobiales bacterium]|nr:hypothetical protein [Thermomicrobiales bacterium]